MTVRHYQLSGIALGLAVTAATCVVALSHWDGFERIALDKRFLYANRLRADPRILHVDIDDGSLERVGRWPWNRDTLADLVRTLTELKAGVIVIDLLLDTAQVRRWELPEVDPASADAPETIGRFSEQNEVYPDLELTDAIRRAGNVFLGVHFDELRPRRDPLPRRAAIRAMLADRPALTPADLYARFSDVPAEQVRQDWLAARLTIKLLEQFDLTEAELAEDIGADRAEVVRALPTAKRDAALERAARFLAEGAEATADAFIGEMLPGVVAGTTTPDTEDLRRAFEAERARQALGRRAGPVPVALEAVCPEASGVIAPLQRLTDAARGVGSVVFRADAGGRLREVSLLVQHEGHLIRQLGFAVACDVLGVDGDSLRLTDDGYLEMSAAGRREPLRVQIDGELARMVIPWTASGPRWRAGDDFRHVPAVTVLALAIDRRLIRDNQRRIGLHMADLIEATKREYSATYVEKCTALARLEYEQHVAALLGGDGTEASRGRVARIEALGREVETLQAGAEAMVEQTIGEIRGLEPEDEEEKELFQRYERAHATLTERIRPLREANRKLEQRIAAARAELAPLVENKIVFIGHAATAEGDIVNTPIDPSLPGVIAHSNVVNAFLAGHFIERPQRSTEIVLILLFGTAATLLTATRGPIATLLITVAAMAGYTLLNFFALFAGLALWVVLVAPLAVIALPWAAVTVFRQLTAERQKRYVQAQLAEFTDPALARRIAENPAAAEALQRVEQRDVTCFFSDLQGFTTIAEQVDADQVQRVLNTYLECMSEVLFRHEAFVNKFLGDGIMAFFNPNVNPQPEHARIACEAALDSFEALAGLKERMRGQNGLYERLHMRIGIASGIGGVGRFGSRRKADYTVIGDVCNLAARLEPANKVFGTRLLVSGSTREVVSDLYEWRYLAELQVKGKQLTVPVFELVCRKGELSEADRDYITRFETGVELYKQKLWDEAIVQFTRILARRFDDAGASAYISACQEKKLFPPEEPWIGALELKEK